MLPSATAFCSQCGAPQVRIPENLTSTTIADDPNAIKGEEHTLSLTSSAIVNWRHALRSASTAGLAMAVACLLPVVSLLFPLWMLAGGWFAVDLYRRRLSFPLLSAAVASKIGALAGLLGFAFFALFTATYVAIATLILHQGEQIRATLRSVLDQAAAKNPDPSTQAIVQWVQTPEGLALAVVFSLFLFLLAFLLFSIAGGLFSATVGRRKLQ